MTKYSVEIALGTNYIIIRIIIIKLINKIIRNKLWLYNEQTTLDGKPKPLAKTYAKWVELTDGMAQQVDIILIITIIIVIINIIASKLTAQKM